MYIQDIGVRDTGSQDIGFWENGHFGIWRFGIRDIGFRENGFRDIRFRENGCFGKMSNSGKGIFRKIDFGKWSDRAILDTTLLLLFS